MSWPLSMRQFVSRSSCSLDPPRRVLGYNSSGFISMLSHDFRTNRGIAGAVLVSRKRAKGQRTQGIGLCFKVPGKTETNIVVPVAGLALETRRCTHEYRAHILHPHNAGMHRTRVELADRHKLCRENFTQSTNSAIPHIYDHHF